MIYHSGQAAAPESGLPDKIINKSCWESDRSAWWMIRATNTIKHLDVKPRLFEEREAGREGVEPQKKISRPQWGSRQGGSNPRCSTSALCWEINSELQPHVWFLCMHLCIAVLCVSVLQSTEAQCESISVIWGRSGSQRGVVLYRRLQRSNVV